MPRRDGTGPEGQGSGTGRGLGPCNTGEQTSANDRRGLKRGVGRAQSQGRGQQQGQGRGRKSGRAGRGRNRR